ncbi:winged helix-turn-helix domain-containing protein [Caldivirga sp.]|uniref:ArsR/SmtB family transcription factor n=1 Tax=Caldivirga sp. TaxID=2080243 RepID=UPI0025B816A3|nr:winged helix-turn-helix domain-containing protein [Caldivirga sp.]
MGTGPKDGLTIRESCSRFSTVVWLFINSRGAEVRFRIIEKLRERPMNINQLAKELGVDYKTIKYHLMVLGKHGFVNRINNSYGSPYYLSDDVFKHWDELIQIINSYKSYKGQ